MIERRADPADRRPKRLFLTPATRPLLEQLSVLGEETMAGALAGVDRTTVQQMVEQLTVVKDNLRRLIQQRDAENAAGERRYG